MIQRILNIIVSFLLLFSTAGVIIHEHYSGGELYSIGIFKEAESCCATECNCCTEEVEVIQLKENYLTSAFSFDYIPAFTDFIYEELIPEETISENNFETKLLTHPPGRTIDHCSDLQVFLL